MAFPADYTLLAKLSTVPAQIAGNETGFVSLITDGSLGAQATNIFANTDNGGGDVRLSSDAAGTLQLPVEVVSWDTIGGTCVIWTRHDVDATTAVDIYVWGDNTGDTQPLASAAFGRDFVWAGIEDVRHGNDLVDSSGNNADLTVVSAATTNNAGFNGGGAFNSNKTSGFWAVGGSNSGSYTFRQWINFNSFLAGGNSNQRPIGLFDGTDGAIMSLLQSDKLALYTIGGNDRGGSVPATKLITNTWYHAVCVWDTTANTITHYLDGNQDRQETGYTDTSPTTNPNIAYGISPSSLSGDGVDALQQWCSVEYGTPSANRIQTEYNNQNAPVSFWTASAIAAGIDVTPSTVNSDSVALNPTVTVNVDTNVSGQVVNTSSISNNPTLQFNTDINVQGVVVNSDSVANNPAINIGSNITVNGQVVNSDSVSNDPTVNITSSVFVVGQVVNTESISNDPSLQFDLSISGSTSNTDSVSLDPSISFGLVVSGQTVNTESVSNNPTLQFNIDISGQTVNTLSNSINPAIQIGEITYSIDTATNMDALSLSININAPILSTNING